MAALAATAAPVAASGTASRDAETSKIGGYRMGVKIGAGSFGEIFLAVDLKTGERYAAKMESLKTKNAQLFYEYKVYKSIKIGIGVPKIHYYGVTATHSVMIMDLLGQSLEGLFNMCSRNFSLKTILMLAIQLIDRVECMHCNFFLHRDIKPDNFLIGAKPSDSHVIYMVDMGLCKRYRDIKTKRHIPYRGNKKLTGTPRFASINTHNGSEQGRRDDLESLGYLLMYLTRGSLPWQGLKAATKQEKYDKIGKKKRDTPIEILCQECPQEFATYLKYCSNLSFAEKPDYLFLKGLFDSLFRKQGYEYDWIYDWDDLAAHEIYVKRLAASKLKKSPSEVGLEQLYKELDQTKVDRDNYKIKCEGLQRQLAELQDMIQKPIVAKPVQATSMNGRSLTQCPSTSSDSLAVTLRKRKRATKPVPAHQ